MIKFQTLVPTNYQICDLQKCGNLLMLELVSAFFYPSRACFLEEWGYHSVVLTSIYNEEKIENGWGWESGVGGAGEI